QKDSLVQHLMVFEVGVNLLGDERSLETLAPQDLLFQQADVLVSSHTDLHGLDHCLPEQPVAAAMTGGHQVCDATALKEHRDEDLGELHHLHEAESDHRSFRVVPVAEPVHNARADAYHVLRC
ncbi:hypothetical protein EGW08_009978, partial [Elysia chlorotica]